MIVSIRSGARSMAGVAGSCVSAGLTVLQLQQVALFQAARVAPRRGFVLGAGRSTSAGTPKRVRSRWIIDMLSPFLPRRTSLTRLAVPRIGIMSARESPC
jgi:hypothetical protein